MMGRIVETKWNELWPMVNILNEVCHGIYINNIEGVIGFKYDAIIDLLQKISVYQVGENMSEKTISIELNDCEIKMLTSCFNEVLKQIEDWEFSTRIGVSIKEASKIKEKMTGPVLKSGNL